MALDALGRFYRVTFVHEPEDEPQPQGSAPRGMMVSSAPPTLFSGSVDDVDGSPAPALAPPQPPPPPPAADVSLVVLGLEAAATTEPPPLDDRRFSFEKPLAAKRQQQQQQQEEDGLIRNYPIEANDEQYTTARMTRKAGVTFDNSLLLLFIAALLFLGVLIVYRNVTKLGELL